MNKVTSSILAVAMLSVCLPNISPVSVTKSAEANSIANQPQVSKHHLNLKLNLSEEALDWMTREAISKGNQQIFHDKLSNNSAEGNLELNFEITSGQLKGYDDITGKGIVRVGNVTGTVEFQDDIQKFTVSSGKTIYSSAVEATFKFGNEEYKGLIGLTFDPNSDAALVSTSIGAISDKGTGMAFFGEPFMEMYEVKQQKLQQLQGNSLNIEQQSSDVPVAKISNASSGTIASLTDNGTFNYKTSSDSKYLRYTSESSSGYVGNSVVGINVYDRDPSVNGNGSGAVEVRAWSNNQAVINYANSKDPYHFNTTSYVDEGYISFSAGNFLNITAAGPADGSTISKWDFLANVPLLGDALDFLANTYVYLYNANIPITSTKTVDASTGLTNYWRKNLKTLGKSADFPYISDTAYPRRGNTEGGVTAKFFYSEYTGGTQSLTAGARMDYMVDSGNLYWGLFYSDAAMAYWSANFM